MDQSERFSKESINPVGNIYNSFTVFMLTLMSTKIVRLRVFRKNKFPLPKLVYMTLNSMTQTRERWNCHVLSRPDFWMIWRCYCIPCVHFIYLFIYFCLESTLGKDTWMTASSATVIVLFLKVPFWKLLDQSSFSRISWHIQNSILKEILQLKILRTWIKIRANTFLKTWGNIMQWKTTKLP